jgi:hypothetical protein
MSLATVTADPRPALGHRILREVPLLVALYLIYQIGRVIAGDHATAAFGNAEQVWDVERWLGLPDEAAIQQWVWDWPALVQAANTYYATMHFPVTCAVLVWIFVWRPAAYPWFRWTLVSLTALGLVGHLAYPLAPPRMLTHHGLLDTGVLFGQSVYSPPGTGIANQFAAMPSLHVGWAALIAIAIVVTTRTRWRWLALAHPVLTVLVVVVTANHYWVDGLVALALLAGSLYALRRLLPEPPSDDLEPNDPELTRRDAPVEPAGSELAGPGGPAEPGPSPQLIGVRT